MENFNLAQLATPVAVKNVANDIPMTPQKTPEKKFSGVLTREESRVDAAENGSSANEKRSQKVAADQKADRARKADKAQKAESRTQSRSSKKEPPENSAAKTDEIPETGENVVAAVPAEEVVIDESAKNNRLAEVAKGSEIDIPALFAEISEDMTQAIPTESKGLADLESESGMLDEAAAAQNNLFSPAVTGDNPGGELPLPGLPVGKYLYGETGTRRLTEEPAENELAAKLSPAEITTEFVAESVIDENTGKLPASGAEIEFNLTSAGKKKIDLLQDTKVKVGNSEIKVENTEVRAKKIEANMENANTASDFSAPAAAVNPVGIDDETGGRQRSRMVEGLSQPGGVSLDEIPDEVEVRVESEIIASDEKLQQKRNFSDRLAAKQSVSGSRTGTVHLQGRARENQSSMLQNGSEQKDMTGFAEGKNHRSRAAFMDEMQRAVSEKTSSATTLQSGVKEKPLAETNFSKTVLLTDTNSDLTNTSAVKQGSRSILSKPLPITDNHLLNQIQAGLTQPVNGRQTVTIKLWPEHLGRVDIKLVMNKQHLTATFMVDHPEVKDAMMRKVDSLRDSLGLRGIDAKDISIKIAPAKSGDGPSLMADNQPQNGNSAWRQFNQGNFTNGNSQSQSGWGEDGSSVHNLTETEVITETMTYADNVVDPGSLHITA